MPSGPSIETNPSFINRPWKCRVTFSESSVGVAGIELTKVMCTSVLTVTVTAGGGHAGVVAGDAITAIRVVPDALSLIAVTVHCSVVVVVPVGIGETCRRSGATRAAIRLARARTRKTMNLTRDMVARENIFEKLARGRTI